MTATAPAATDMRSTGTHHVRLAAADRRDGAAQDQASKKTCGRDEM